MRFPPRVQSQGSMEARESEYLLSSPSMASFILSRYCLVFTSILSRNSRSFLAKSAGPMAVSPARYI